MIRILQVVNMMDRAGLETMLMNYYRNIDRTKVQFDFLTHRENDGAYDEEIKQLGGKVYHAPRLMPQNYPAYFKWMKNFFKEHPEYKIVHSHIDTMSFFPLYAAKLSNIPLRISHSHSSKLDKDFKFPIKYVAKLFLPKVANTYFSCGQKAGEFLYKNRNFKIVNNACDVGKFVFENNKREELKEKFELENKFVIGHVGRYCYIKNQLFILDIFKEFLSIKKDSVLVLIGKGPDEDKIREKIKTLGIEDKVLLLIDRNDVNELYNMMDAFIMPSLFEGLPVVAVEAQINGLKCFMSDKISDEVKITDTLVMISLDKSAKEWAEIIYTSNCERNRESVNQIKQKGYDISVEAKKLMEYYIHINSGLE